MGRLRRKSSTAKEGSQQSKGQTAIDQFFCKGPAQRGGLFTQVGLPARKESHHNKGNRSCTTGNSLGSTALSPRVDPNSTAGKGAQILTPPR
ncbi:Hypp7855 [Branchiostoma lanceolatum]|uniref:Hypp7855 protein n=1 Tax=Branchiostoma lanceolatum TaxID=7740 RepID=A0A8J9Z404_BRALA|nr:Hypp7855 [Branchiostoma lanceolatum]